MGKKVNKGWAIGRTVLLGLLLTSGSVLGGCSGGGESSYDDLHAEYSAGDVESSLLSPQTLRAWDANAGVLDDGLYMTDQGERVVLVDVLDTTANMTNYHMQGHLPGAVVNLSHEGGETMDRNDGPMVEPHDVADGPAVDQMIQKLGITKDAVVVVTTTKPKYDFCSSRFFWTLQYWGFSRHNVKVLDGGLVGWKAVGGQLSTAPPVNPQPSTMSVVDLPGPRTELRTTIGELFALMDSGKINRLDGEVILLDVRPPLSKFTMGTADTSDDIAFAYASRSGMAIDAIPRGAVLIPTTSPVKPAALFVDGNVNGYFKSKEELKAAFDSVGIDGSKPIVVYCNSGASAARYYYVLSEILGYNVSEFDASMLTWTNLVAYQPGDLTYVRHDAVVSDTGVISPDDQSRFFRWDENSNQFIDYLTGNPVPPGSIVPGGNLGGNDYWDTIKRSEFVVFRPTATVNSGTTGTQTYNPVTQTGISVFNGDWAPVTTYPFYTGAGSEAQEADENYQGGAGGAGEAPSSTSGGGGGC